jgi:hypothetical protein
VSDEKRAQPDDSEPSPERQAELRAAYEANVTAGKAPYAGVPIRTHGELNWVGRERRWSGEFNLPEASERANLSGANLISTDLRNASLQGADRSGASLMQAYLDGADLRGANLREASFDMASMGHVMLAGADLRGAQLTEVWLAGADLRERALT